MIPMQGLVEHVISSNFNLKEYFIRKTMTADSIRMISFFHVISSPTGPRLKPQIKGLIILVPYQYILHYEWWCRTNTSFTMNDGAVPIHPSLWVMVLVMVPYQYILHYEWWYWLSFWLKYSKIMQRKLCCIWPQSSLQVYTMMHPDSICAWTPGLVKSLHRPNLMPDFLVQFGGTIVQ